MRTIPLTFAATRQHSGLAARCASGVAEHWPRNDEHARVRLIATDLLRPLLAGSDATVPDVALDHPIVVFVDDQMPIHEIAQLADALSQRQTPAIFLFRDPIAARSLLSDSTAITDSWTIDPKIFAPMLYALAHRQSAVREMGAELRLTQHALSGLTAEMERLHNELELAAMVQREFIPRASPTFPGIDIGIIFRPVGFVSGDIYDIQRLEDQRIAFFLADAVGHGVPAALLTMAITRALQPKSNGTFDPSAALKQLNIELARHPNGTHRFATAICGTLNLETNELSIAGAGHPYPLLTSSRGVRLLETDGPMLGVFEDADFPSITTRLASDETFVIHSDGLEASLEAHEMSVPQVTQVFAEDAEVSMSESLSRLQSMLDGGIGSLHQQDDVTVLAMRLAELVAPLRIAA